MADGVQPAEVVDGGLDDAPGRLVLGHRVEVGRGGSALVAYALGHLLGRCVGGAGAVQGADAAAADVAEGALEAVVEAAEVAAAGALVGGRLALDVRVGVLAALLGGLALEGGQGAGAVAAETASAKVAEKAGYEAVAIQSLQKSFVKRAARYIRKYKPLSDKRLKTENELMGAMNVIKMYSWEDPFFSRVDAVKEAA